MSIDKRCVEGEVRKGRWTIFIEGPCTHNDWLKAGNNKSSSRCQIRHQQINLQRKPPGKSFNKRDGLIIQLPKQSHAQGNCILAYVLGILKSNTKNHLPKCGRTQRQERLHNHPKFTLNTQPEEGGPYTQNPPQARSRVGQIRNSTPPVKSVKMTRDPEFQKPNNQ